MALNLLLRSGKSPGPKTFQPMLDPPFTVIAADDHPVVLSGVRLVLRGAGDFKLLAETQDGASTLAAIKEEVPDLLILDLWMGDNDGIELLRKIHDGWPSIRVLVYSMNDERSYGIRALRAGAAGYLMKSHGLDELVNALRIVAADGRYLSADLASEWIGRRLASEPGSANSRAIATLSDRELQILRLIGMEQTTAAIAKSLNLSTKTVEAHRGNLKNKLNLADSGALDRQAVHWVESHVL